jgi:hypothetical protein
LNKEDGKSDESDKNSENSVNGCIFLVVECKADPRPAQRPGPG